MECTSGARLAGVGCTAKKKRSGMPRRPRPDLRSFIHSCTFLQPTAESIDGGNIDGNQYFKDTMVGSDGLGSESRLKLKLKFGGVTHTIQTNSSVEHPQHRQKQDKDINCFYPSEKGKSNGLHKKDFPKSGSSYLKLSSSRGKTSGGVSVNETYESIRKSKRIPKRRALDVGFNGDDDNEDEELRYLGRLNEPKVVASYEDEDTGFGKEQGTYEDKDYVEEEEPTSEDEPGSKKKKLEKVVLDSFVERRNELIPTTRNRAFHSGKDVLSRSGGSLIEFPNGLPSAPSKKQKEKLSEVEQQLKKAEAAQRRRMQSEKAAREAEAEAIRKILGQDSGRKKDEKMKKQRDELAQDKAAKSSTLASNTVRWIFGPSGTIAIFSEDIGLPNIFNSVPCSLQCYRAIHGKKHPLISC
ncbi:uncharacterized protein LOC123220226 isoform X2 [Mangifera indica]|uniref:uncharacterized protein LOC123220226 isoform X2 n=1 Tax=Mangifera indica TaxID=29780 RepID=UPI001CFA197F|nr:uncharacterized protein LOC123220226 isoform X2 [Mangifera indica]